MGLGLLGALQGAGQSMTQFGNALFAEETERQRQAELQKIRDTDYKRGRADQLTDQQTSFDRQDKIIAQEITREDTLRTDDREYQAGLLDAANTLYDERLATANDLTDERYRTSRDDDAGLIMSVDVGADGEVYGITKGGTMKSIGDITVVNPTLGNAMDAYQTLSKQIQYELLDRENNPEPFERLGRYADQIERLVNESAANFGSGSMSTEDAVDLGRLLFNGQDEVDLDGTITSGQDLDNARANYRRQYPSLFDLIGK